ELPVRPGYQVEPEAVTADLPKAARLFEANGLEISSVAGYLDEATVMACGDSGVPILRTMCRIDPKLGFTRTIEDYHRTFEGLIPALERANVTIGVQNHSGYFIGSAAGMLYLLDRYDPKHVCAVLDMAHCAVAGEPVELAVDILWSRLNGLVNFKSAYQHRVNGPEEPEAKFKIRWTSCHHAAYSWREFFNALMARGFSGTICLPTEYSDPEGKPQRMGDDVMYYLREDLAYLGALIETR
ncbi:MAG: TIM barrel protein, partial [Pseudomonadota bacterium]